MPSGYNVLEEHALCVFMYSNTIHLVNSKYHHKGRKSCKWFIVTSGYDILEEHALCIFIYSNAIHLVNSKYRHKGRKSCKWFAALSGCDAVVNGLQGYQAMMQWKSMHFAFSCTALPST